MTEMRMTRAAFVLAALTLAPIAAQAAPIEIKGNAQACFGSDCLTFGESASTTIGGVTLSYDSDSIDFWGFTEDDLLSINGATGNFGTMSVSTPDVKTPVSTAFTLLLTFINPISPSATFDAAIRGTVSVLANGGGIVVNFNPDMVEGLAISDPATGQTGTMSVTAFDVPISSGGQANLTGLVETQLQPAATSVPEPGSLVLLGTGLAGIVVRRGRKTQA
jgi:hypothetical protein